MLKSEFKKGVKFVLTLKDHPTVPLHMTVKNVSGNGVHATLDSQPHQVYKIDVHNYERCVKK